MFEGFQRIERARANCYAMRGLDHTVRKADESHRDCSLPISKYLEAQLLSAVIRMVTQAISGNGARGPLMLPCCQD